MATNFSDQGKTFTKKSLPPLPPKPTSQVSSLFSFDSSLVNTFPEAENVALKYDVLPPKLEQPYSASPEESSQLQNSFSQPSLVQQASPQVYYTPPQNGYVPVADYATQSRIRSTLNRPFLKGVTVFASISIAVMILMLFGFFTLVTASAGAVLAAIIMAGGAFTAIFFALKWVGKWDPEPLGIKLLAFLYGAAGSVLLTFGIAMIWGLLLGEPDLFVGAVIQAPIVEEFTKGLGILVMLWVFKKYIDGPVDGLIFASLIAAGFAFTENVLYLSQAYLMGGAGGVAVTGFVRLVMSPFAHIMFTLPMGIVIGFAAAKQFSVIKTLLLWFAAYLVGVLLHGLWNGSAVLADGNQEWFLFYLLVQIPIFIISAGVVLWLRKRETLLAYRTLTQYGQAGWLTFQEVETFATWDGRKSLIRWAKLYAPNKKELVEDLTKDVIDLVHVREKINSGRLNKLEKLILEEKELLNQVQLKKQQIAA